MPIFRSAPDLRGFGQPSTPDVLVLNGLPGRLLARLMPDLLPQPDEVPGLLDELVHHVAYLGGTRDAILYQSAVTGTLRPRCLVMPTEVGIHAFSLCKQRRGWRACACHDGGGDRADVSNPTSAV